MSQLKDIIFYSYSIHKHQEMILLAKVLKSNFNIKFIINDESFIPSLQEEDIEYICIHCKNSIYNKNSFFKSILNNKFISKFLNQKTIQLSIIQYLKEKIYYNIFNHYAKLCTTILKKNNTSLLVTIADRHLFHIEMGLIKAAKDLNIPIFLPFIAQWSAEVNYLSIKNNPNYMLTNKSSIYERIVLKKYTYQMYKNRFYYQAFLFKALDNLNILSEMPWLNGGGASDIVALPNKLSYNQHINMGIKKEKLRILGDISYLTLYNIHKNREKLKATIIKKYNLQHHKIIIINLPNWKEQNLAPEKKHWEIIFKTIESTLNYQNEYSILISLHPRKIINDYLFLKEKYNITIIEERLMQILPISDIYIADQSSTILWSILCGIKTLSVCYYKRMDIFTDFRSIVFADKEDELENQLHNLISHDISFTHDWDLLSRNKVFHDNIIENYINIFNQMTITK